MIFFSDLCNFSGSHLISWHNICQHRKGWQSKRLASAQKCQRIAFIPRIEILLPLVYTKLCLHDQVLASINRSNKCQKKKEVTILGPAEQTKHIFIWTFKASDSIWYTESSFDHSTSVWVSWFYKGIYFNASLKGLGAVLSKRITPIKSVL